jgi:hypothetical protein
MKRRTLALLALFTACAGDDLVPKSGTWMYGGSELVSNSCGGDPPTDPAGNFKLTVTGDGAFTVDDGDFDLPFDCTHDGASFTCPNRDSGMYKVENIDATIYYELSVTGTFADDTSLSGTQVVKVRCEGGSCELAATLAGYTVPCEYSYDFSAIAQ